MINEQKSITISHLLRLAGDLKSEDGENGEYDRALVNLIGAAAGLVQEEHGSVAERLGMDWEAILQDDANQALRRLADTIDATGGVLRDHKGYPCPVGNPNPKWVDLGEAYLRACRALKRDPVIAEETGEAGRDD